MAVLPRLLMIVVPARDVAASVAHSATTDNNASATSGTLFAMLRQRMFNRSALIFTNVNAPTSAEGDELNCSLWSVVTTINNASHNFDLLAPGHGTTWCLVLTLACSLGY